MGCFKKLYDKNYEEPKPEIEFNGWTNQWSDIHDYWNEIDEGYLTHKQLCDYNNLLKVYRDVLTDNEIWSMTNSNELEDE
jgi:hypothetical protein|tara:strand:- start:457 stop:696 length:240 start_codon:yes stop_codon:yes gene_type:complete